MAWCGAPTAGWCTSVQAEERVQGGSSGGCSMLTHQVGGGARLAAVKGPIRWAAHCAASVLPEDGCPARFPIFALGAMSELMRSNRDRIFAG